MTKHITAWRRRGAASEIAARLPRSMLGIKLQLTYSRAEVMRMYAAMT